MKPPVWKGRLVFFWKSFWRWLSCQSCCQELPASLFYLLQQLSQIWARLNLIYYCLPKKNPSFTVCRIDLRFFFVRMCLACDFSATEIWQPCQRFTQPLSYHLSLCMYYVRMYMLYRWWFGNFFFFKGKPSAAKGATTPVKIRFFFLPPSSSSQSVDDVSPNANLPDQHAAHEVTGHVLYSGRTSGHAIMLSQPPTVACKNGSSVGTHCTHCMCGFARLGTDRSTYVCTTPNRSWLDHK